jgi:hypothetical protein
MPNGSIATASIVGLVVFPSGFQLQNVFYIPEFTCNLISVSRLLNCNNYKLTFFSNLCHIQDLTSLRMIGLADLHNGLYLLRTTGPHDTMKPMNFSIVNSYSSFDLWHYRLGHPSTKVLKHVATIFPYVQIQDNKICDSCHFAKLHRLPFPSSTSYSLNAFDMVHVDIWGPLAINSVNGYSYFLTIVDDHTRHTWIYLMKNKSEARQLLQNFVSLIHTQYKTIIKIIRSDNGQEFNCPSYYSSLGIIHQKEININK